MSDAENAAMLADELYTRLKAGEAKEEAVYKARIAPENIKQKLLSINKSQLKHVDVGPAKKFKFNPRKG